MAIFPRALHTAHREAVFQSVSLPLGGGEVGVLIREHDTDSMFRKWCACPTRGPDADRRLAHQPGASKGGKQSSGAAATFCCIRLRAHLLGRSGTNFAPGPYLCACSWSGPTLRKAPEALQAAMLHMEPRLWDELEGPPSPSPSWTWAGARPPDPRHLVPDMMHRQPCQHAMQVRRPSAQMERRAGIPGRESQRARRWDMAV